MVKEVETGEINHIQPFSKDIYIVTGQGINRTGLVFSMGSFCKDHDILAMLNDAVKKGGIFASKTVGGLSGAFIPVMEDSVLADAVGNGSLCLEKLESMTCVCSVGLDIVAIPGSVDADTIAAIIAEAHGML